MRINKLLKQYPACGHLNLAIRFLLKGDTETGIKEILYAMFKSHCYFYDDLLDKLAEENYITKEVAEENKGRL